MYVRCLTSSCRLSLDESFFGTGFDLKLFKFSLSFGRDHMRLSRKPTALFCSSKLLLMQLRFSNSSTPSPATATTVVDKSNAVKKQSQEVLLKKPAAPRMSASIREAANDDGIGGFDGNLLGSDNGGSIAGFLDAKKRKLKEAEASGVRPCDVPNSDAADQSTVAEQEALMAKIASSGKLPSPKRESPPQQPLEPQSTSKPMPTPIHRSSLPRPLPAQEGGGATSGRSSLPRKPLFANKPTTGAPSPTSSSSSAEPPQYTGASDAADYYKDLPRQELSKEEMWSKIQQRAVEQAEQHQTALEATEAEYLKMEEELKEHDLFHFRVGEVAFPDETMRRDYWAMWQLLVSLNKARWTMFEIHAQRGVKTTGANMKMLFWKESIYQIAEKRDFASGQFVESHPVLRPFAAAIKRRPKITKTFIRGFADARLKVIQQPANMKQLFDHFDKFYGYFFNVMLEVLDIKDDHAEHAMCHIGRAIGLTQHCVMFWKKYARLGFTMLPADMCADHHVNLTLLKNITLASRDRAVRHLLCSVMAVVKEEMMHAQEAVKHCSPKIWPLLTEAFYPNYYLGFLQKNEFNVGAMFADHNIENAGFMWFRLKKRWEWERHQDLQRLVSESAPLPFIGTSWGHRGSQYRKVEKKSGDAAVGGEGLRTGTAGLASCDHSHSHGQHHHH